MPIDYEILPLTAERWPAGEQLFGPKGACQGCWCMYWRLPRSEWLAACGDEARRLFLARVLAGPPPGLLAFADGQPVGWMQIGPRADTPEWNGARRLSAPLADATADEAGVWGVTCFFVRTGWRGKGITAALLAEGIAHARRSGARVLEACPIARSGKVSASTLYVGTAAVFARAGFRTVATRKESRPLVRLELSGPGSRSRSRKPRARARGRR